MPGQTAGSNGKVPALKGKKQKAPFWAKAVTALGAFLAVLSVSGIVGVKYFLGQLTDNIQTTSSVLDGESGGGAGKETGKLPDGAINLLMLGLDTRESWGKEGIQSRSDTMIILHISKAHDQAYMISIPRDAKVNIPADSSLGTSATTDKINGAYSLGSEKGRGWTGGAKLAPRPCTR